MYSRVRGEGCSYNLYIQTETKTGELNEIIT